MRSVCLFAMLMIGLSTQVVAQGLSATVAQVAAAKEALSVQTFDLDLTNDALAQQEDDSLIAVDFEIVYWGGLATNYPDWEEGPAIVETFQNLYDEMEDRIEEFDDATFWPMAGNQNTFEIDSYSGHLESTYDENNGYLTLWQSVWAEADEALAYSPSNGQQRFHCVNNCDVARERALYLRNATEDLRFWLYSRVNQVSLLGPPDRLAQLRSAAVLSFHNRNN